MSILYNKAEVMGCVFTIIAIVMLHKGVAAFITITPHHGPQNSRQLAQSQQYSMLQIYPSPKLSTTLGPNFRTSAINLHSSVTFDSTLVPSDTIPSFRAAHGLLSPQTVMRIEGRIANDGRCSKAVLHFLKTYYTLGPMACIPVLSNPDALPQLTRAMRDSSSSRLGDEE